MESKIKSLKNLTSTKFLNMYEIHYTNKFGNDKKWTAVSRVNFEEYKDRLFNQKKSSDAVLIAAYHIDEEKLVLIRQYRVPINKYIFEIPAGLIDKNETINECVRRELLEETGLELVDIKTIYDNIYLSPGITDECADLVFCTCKGNMSYKYLEDDENLTIHLADVKEIDKIINNKEEIDLKTLFVMKLFKILGKNFVN